MLDYIYIYVYIYIYIYIYLMIVPCSPIKFGNALTLMIHIYFSSLARFRYLSLVSLPFNFTLWSDGTVKSTINWFFFFFFFFVDYHLVYSSG